MLFQIDSELEDARWFNRRQVFEMITNSSPAKLFVPPPQALAHQLIKQWLIRTSGVHQLLKST